jgi:hypothetical protein
MKENLIYHYCRMEAFFNIINSKKIWLSDALKTNDLFELRWILEIMNMPNIGVTIDNFRNEYEYWLKTYMRPHIACFSKNGDLLSQWRGYANDGKGIAIGFDKRYFEGISDLENKETVLKEVVYELEKQRLLLDKYISTSQIEKFYELNKELDVASIVMVRDIVEYGLIFKHHSFIEEDEFRLIHGFGKLTIESENIKFRPLDNNLVSYVEIPLDIESEYYPIKEVVVGPKNISDIRDIKDFVERKFGINREVKVTRSVSSYR